MGTSETQQQPESESQMDIICGIIFITAGFYMLLTDGKQHGPR